jgi:endogenous inhibitor of DNA gyrase (YacG/DUF329 family)
MSEGTIKFTCACGKAYKVKEKYAGKRIKCPECGETVAVPSASEPVASARASAVSQKAVVSTSKRVSGEGSAAPGKSARVASSAPAPTRRPGGDTQIVEAPDLTPDMKKYQRKRDEEMQRGTAKLVLFADGKAVKSFRLDKDPKTLGRGSSNDIQIEGKSVSKSHLKFEYMMGMFICTDQQSANGLVVNGKKIRRASLKDGDIIQLGDVVLRIDCGK